MVNCRYADGFAVGAARPWRGLHDDERFAFNVLQRALGLARHTYPPLPPMWSIRNEPKPTSRWATSERQQSWGARLLHIYDSEWNFVWVVRYFRPARRRNFAHVLDLTHGEPLAAEGLHNALSPLVEFVV